MRDKILGGVSFSPHRYFNMHVLKNSTLWKFTCFDKLSGLKYMRLTFNKTKYDDVPELVMSSSTISRIQVVLLRVSSLLRSNHQATAKVDGYNQRYRENRTKNTRRGGAWRVSYAAWCWLWWSDPTRRSSWGALLLVWERKTVTIFFQLVPIQPRPQGFFLRKREGKPWGRALCQCRFADGHQYAWRPPEPNWRNICL